MLWLLIACLLSVLVADPQRRYTNNNDNNDNNNNNNKHFCSSVKKVVTAFKQQKPASKYCISYLKITPSITTSTVTVPPTPGPCHASPVAGAGNLLKRQPYEPKPKCFAGYTKKSVISSACSCIVTRPLPTTTTITVTSGVQPLPTTPSTFRVQAVEVDDSEVPEAAVVNGNYGIQQPDLTPFLPNVYFNAPPAALGSALVFTFVPGTNNLQTSTDIIRVLVGERARGDFAVAGERRLELAPPDRQDTGPEPLVPVNCTIVPREDQTCTLNCIRPGFTTDRTHIALAGDGDAQWLISDTDTVDVGGSEFRFRAIAVEV